ncbi:MAG: hypothetical protein ABJV04_16715 [Aliiglaciecola sp.]|uniref:hypothetical protein n=1 Tax=Aliiglaciecola sp. TaxID=1872441 RepID=UPI003298915A
MTINFTFVSLLFGVLIACTPKPALSANSGFFDIMDSPIGSVDFPNSCNATAAPLVERAVALLHHMMYDEANFLFSNALVEDKSCAIALWGKAMSKIHPLWPGGPSTQDLQDGAILTEKGLNIDGTTQREKAYLMTTHAYFIAGSTKRNRLKKFEAAWKSLSEQFPQDYEALAFYALSLLATANKSDQSYEQNQAAAKIAKLVLTANPQHPGAHHYIIHAYDTPSLAHMASEVADNYGKITPKVPHAAHMLSHIYTRLGEWTKSIKWNKMSSETAWEMCVSSGVINSHYTHALDYLAYAYLQKGDDGAVKSIIDNLTNIKAPYNKTNHASAYAFSAIPARFVAERQDWESATKLQPQIPSNFPWDESHRPYIAITHFVKAIGFARTSQVKNAQEEIAELNKLQTQIANESDYWALQVTIQMRAAEAWMLYAQGNKEQGLIKMSEAASLELSTQKHPITPGAIIPASELLGDMLMQEGLYIQAIDSYEASLNRNPKRLNTMLGLFYAHKALSNTDAINTYYEDIKHQVNDSAYTRKALIKLIPTIEL